MISSRPRPVGRRRLGPCARPALTQLGALPCPRARSCRSPHARARSGSRAATSAAVSGRSGSPRPGRQCTAGASQRLAAQARLVDLHARQLRQLVGRRARSRQPLRARGRAARARNASNVGGVERGAVVELDRDHHPVADRDRRARRTPRADRTSGWRGDDRLDRRGGEVLAVDAQPLVRPAGEVEPAVGVAVGEVARPVPAVAEPCERRPPRCCSSPRTPSPARCRRSRRPPPRAFVEPAVARRTRPRGHSSPVSGSTTLMVVVGRAERTGRHRRVAADDDDALGRAVAVAHVAAEAARRTRGCRPPTPRCRTRAAAGCRRRRAAAGTARM